jgi:hypothetical protein
MGTIQKLIRVEFNSDICLLKHLASLLTYQVVGQCHFSARLEVEQEIKDLNMGS